MLSPLPFPMPSPCPSPSSRPPLALQRSPHKPRWAWHSGHSGSPSPVCPVTTGSPAAARVTQEQLADLGWPVPEGRGAPAHRWLQQQKAPYKETQQRLLARPRAPTHASSWDLAQRRLRAGTAEAGEAASPAAPVLPHRHVPRAGLSLEPGSPGARCQLPPGSLRAPPACPAFRPTPGHVPDSGPCGACLSRGGTGSN